MGALGTGINSHPTRRLTVDLPRLSISVLPKLGGTAVLRWTGAASALLAKVTRAAGAITIELGGTSTEVLLRSWPIPAGRRRDSREFTIDRMICPRCDTARNILHWGGEEIGWGCRGAACLNLDFPVRHRERWCPAIRRRAKLLRKLARYSPRGLRARAIRVQIAQQEAAMLTSMKRANSDLTKRRRRQNGQRRDADDPGR
jgi:hypothetical protein